MNPIARLGIRARRGFGRVVPDPFAIAVALTVVVVVAAWIGGFPPLEILSRWAGNDGIWALLGFTMQMCVMLVLGTSLALAQPVARAISAVVGLARTERQLVGITAFAAIALSLVNWSLTLIGGALLARVGGELARSRDWKLHYPLLCAAGYAGMMTWHGGLSGSALLKAASASDMAEVLGLDLAGRVGVISLDDTLLSGLNIGVNLALLLLGPALFMLLCPPSGADPDPTIAPKRTPDEPVGDTDASGIVERIERSPLISLALAALVFAGLGQFVASAGFSALSFNTVNLGLLGAALVAHGNPMRFAKACEQGAKSCAGVVIQFPLYAGIMGVMSAAGLSTALSNLFVSVGASSFEVVAFASAGVLNLLVPSGGGQWAVQGPILMESALRLGTSPARSVLAMAYGDQWTNMLQPFWALPLLAITGVRARDIVGYSALWMLLGGIVIVGALLL